MNRRHCLHSLLGLSVAGAASAGIMDWYNGAKLEAALPEYDADYILDPPPSEFKLLLVDFWATWCAPCREEFPHLNALHANFASQGLVVVGLTKESRAVAEAFLHKVSVDYSVGAGGRRPLQQALGIKALPYAVLVDRKRTIVWRGQASALTADEVARRLRGAA